MPLTETLAQAGPLPPELAQAVDTIRSRLERGEIEAAEAAAAALLEQQAATPHVFLLLSEAAARRGDQAAALDFLRNACLWDGSHPPLITAGLKTLVDADRPLDARDIILHLKAKEELPAILNAVRSAIQRGDVLDQVLVLIGRPDSKLTQTLAGETLPAVPVASLEESDLLGSATVAPAEEKGAESSLIESVTLESPLAEMSAHTEKVESLLPDKTPFIDTPTHFLAQKISCPGLAEYLLPLPPTWNVPRTDKLFHQATGAIIRTVDFLEAAHYRGVWPTSFQVVGLENPESGLERRPKEFLWELGEPGFARTVLAVFLPAYEATRHITALKHAVRSAKALAAHQNRLGGWARTYRIRQDLGRGVPVSSPFNAVWIGSDVTCVSLCLLVAATQQFEAPMITTAAMRTVQAIIQSQNSDGSWPMVWVEQEKLRAEFERQYGKACLLDHVMDNALRTLALARYALHRVDVVPSMVAATQWLLKNQQTGKAPGWLAAYVAGGQPGPYGPFVSLSATMSAIDALCFGAAVCDAGPCIEAAQRALHWVESFERSTKAIGDFYDPASGQVEESPVLETGLGGRLDATNIVSSPAATIITPIAMDHMNWFGTDLRDIAAEKAGILKAGIPAIFGPQLAEAETVLEVRAAELQAPMLRWGREWRAAATERGWRFEGTRWQLELPLSRLPGRHQIDNAAGAVACLERLDQFAFTEAAIAAGLRAVEWPARMQRLTEGPLVASLQGQDELWLDGAHNAHAGAMLAGQAAEWRDRPLHLIFGGLKTREVADVLRDIAPSISSLHGVQIPGEAAAHDAEAIAAAARGLGIAAAAAASVSTAVATIRGGANGPIRILICGSLYLAGHVLAENS